MNDSENLEALAVEAEGLDKAPEQAQAKEQGEQALQVVQSNSAELLAALMLARGMALPILPKRKATQLSEVWTDAVLEQAAEAGAAVMQLHGLQLGDMMGRYGPYIALVAALAPPMLATKEILSAPEPQPADVVKPGDGQQ